MKGHIKHGLNLSNSPKAKPRDMKDMYDEGSKEDGKKRREIAHMQRVPQVIFGMTAGNQVHTGPKHKELKENRLHEEVRNSMADWVAGRKSTSDHKKVMKRAKGAMSARSIREGGY